MITGRKLTSEEVTALESKKSKKASGARKVMAELYDSLIADYGVGEYAEVTLGEGEKKITVKNNLKRALDRRGLSATWRRGKADTLKFQVTEKAA